VGQFVLDPADGSKGAHPFFAINPAVPLEHVQSMPDSGARDAVALSQLVLGGKLKDLALSPLLADFPPEQIS
jgi:hypothetical protein